MTVSKQSQDGTDGTVPNVQWKTPDDGQRRCPKHVEFYDRIRIISASDCLFKKKSPTVHVTHLELQGMKVYTYACTYDNIRGLEL